MIWLTRVAFFSMMSVRWRSSGPSAGDSRSSCPAWLIAPTGLRISCAMLALRRPSAASFDCWMRWAITLVSSRNTSTGPVPRSDSDTKCGRITVPPSAETTSPVESRRSCACRRQVASRNSRRGATSAERRPRGDRAARQQSRRGVVDETDPVGGVHHEDALAQVLDDESVELVEVREVDVALADQRLALAQAAGERDREQRDREQARAGESRREEARAVRPCPRAPRPRSRTAAGS